MSTSSLPGFLLRSIPPHGEMNAIASNCHPHSHFFRWQKLFYKYTHSLRHREQEYQEENHRGRYYKHSRWFAASGFGITLATHGGSFDSEHLQNFCETNFDTVRHSRPSVPRSILPSFASGTPFDENSGIVTTSKSLDDDMEDPKSIRNKLSYPRARANHQSFDSSVGPPFNSSPMTLHPGVHPHETLGRTRSNHPLRSVSQSTLVDHNNLPPNCPPTSSQHQLRYLSTSASPPASSCSSIGEASDSAHTAISPNYHQPGSTRLSNRLRNCHSLQFVKQKQKQIQPPYLSHPNSINPQSRPITPLTTSSISNQLPSVPRSPSQSTFSTAHECSSDWCPPEQLPFPASNSATSQSTKFTNFVRSTLQKTSRRSNSQSRSSPLLDLKSDESERDHPSSSSSPPSSHNNNNNNSSRSLTFNTTSEISKSSLLHTYTPPLSMSHTNEAEIESLQDQRASPNKMAPPLRSSFSQPFLNGHYQKTSLNCSRSHSALDARYPHQILKRSESSLSGQTNAPPVTASGSSLQSHIPPKKTLNPTVAGSPPRKSMRTQFSRLAQLLAPSPAPKHPQVTTRVKASSLTSKPKPLFSTGSSSSKNGETRSKHVSCTILDPLPSSSQCGSATTPMSVINWRNTISDHEYRHILKTWGPTEVHRQQLIWELSQTESAFLDSLNVVLDFFINPLKKSECGNWVAGVPEPVQKLFSDLDQIADLHSEIIMGMSYNRMCEKKRNNSPVVIRFADMMATFVPRLRIYERYLVCFEHVCHVIDRLAANQADNFGVFVKIQSDAAGLGGMTLTSYLLKPIQRLMKYPLFFRQLGETTPVGHPDHLPTSNLWKATDGIIRSMQDVKGLEDDHNSLRSLEEQLIGLPDGLVLANRRRKIVARGTFLRVHPSPKDMIKLSEPSHHKVGGNFFAQFGSTPNTRPPSSLALHGDHAYNSTAPRIVRCLSPVSDSSENSEGTKSRSSYHSMNTDSTFDYTNSHHVPIHKLSRTSWSTSGCSADSSPCPDRLSQDWTPIMIKPPRTLSNKRSSHNIMKRGPSTDIIEVILLSDLLVLCVRENPSKKNWRASSKKFEDSNRLKLLDGIGISRLVDAEDIGGQLDNFEELVRLELFPELSAFINRKKKSQTLPHNENESNDDNIIYLSSLNSSNLNGNGESKKVSRACMASWPVAPPSSNSKSGGINTEEDWKNWLKEFKKLELQTHHFYRRHLKHSEQKRRRSTTGKIDVSIKRCSSMNNLGGLQYGS